MPELRRLVTVCRAYYAWNDAEALLRREDLDETVVRDGALLPRRPT
ncbi:MAG: hypothetical protein IPK16_21860 [Anaerolineales bacterium]|nr:hypothetical protein [Anaerolineales bacterium]